MQKLPTIDTYGDYSSKNYGANALNVTIGDLELFYSYKTIVGFQCHAVDGGRRVVIQNYWGPTTGKHLNAICTDKKTRLPSDEFTAQLKIALKAHKFTA